MHEASLPGHRLVHRMYEGQKMGRPPEPLNEADSDLDIRQV
jgi:hypothetical protein